MPTDPRDLKLKAHKAEIKRLEELVKHYRGFERRYKNLLSQETENETIKAQAQEIKNLRGRLAAIGRIIDNLERNNA